ncbi:MAG: carboxypeptidase regulatory-like domain-containing protein, partial [Acidobacteriia bacterium]|nr:carboxypeptidase regulatory-like domain-containing protein [Terriglobia bacterium]
MSAPIVSAQTFTGDISGHVTDSSGLPVLGAEIAATAIATNDKFTTVTNSSGEYSIGFLKPGVYSVVFRAKGFKETVRTGLELQLNQSRRLDQRLQLGSVSEAVEVTDVASEVNYDSPEIAHNVGTEQLENVPEVTDPGRGRSPFLLAKLLPGVTSTSSTNSNINNFSFGGGRPDTNEILIDGLPTTNPSDNTYTFTPSPDSLSEFKVITYPFFAEFGHTGGGVLLATTKGGTNEFHGQLYDYFRNRILNARSFFQASNNARYVQNDPGFNFGGPVMLPRYN